MKEGHDTLSEIGSKQVLKPTSPTIIDPNANKNEPYGGPDSEQAYQSFRIPTENEGASFSLVNNEKGRTVSIIREKEVSTIREKEQPDTQAGTGTPSRRSVVFGRH